MCLLVCVCVCVCVCVVSHRQAISRIGAKHGRARWVSVSSRSSFSYSHTPRFDGPNSALLFFVFAVKALMERGVAIVVYSTVPLSSKKQLQLWAYFYTLYELFSDVAPDCLMRLCMQQLRKTTNVFIEWGAMQICGMYYVFDLITYIPFSFAPFMFLYCALIMAFIIMLMLVGRHGGGQEGSTVSAGGFQVAASLSVNFNWDTL